MIREILKFPDPRLKRKAAAVENLNGEVARVVEDMAETMYAAPGVGLAATQISVPRRIITVDVDSREPGKGLLRLINPVITGREGETVWEEGCLSVVDFTAEVRRAAEVEVKAWTLDEKEITLQANGLLAVALQHEIDHLDGRLFIDRISRLKREIYARRVRKLLKEGRPLESKKGPPLI